MFLLLAAGVLAAWLVVALVLALMLGRAVHIADVKHRDELFVRDLGRAGRGRQPVRV